MILLILCILMYLLMGVLTLWLCSKTYGYSNMAHFDFWVWFLAIIIVLPDYLEKRFRK